MLKNVNNKKADTYEEVDFSDDEYAVYDSMIPIDTLNVSLLVASGKDTGYGSGINWGIRRNGTKRDKNQSYIPYNNNDKKEGFPTRAEVTGTLYRLGETIKEKETINRKLSVELEASKAANAEANKKVAAYDQVNSSLSSKIISLLKRLLKPALLSINLSKSLG